MIKEIKDKLDWMFADLIFDEGRHLYFVNGVPHPSVSSLIKKHETKVDFNIIAERVAEREGKTVEEIQAQWTKVKDDACALGTKTHSYAEFYDGTQIPENGFQEAAKKFFDELPPYYEVVYKELRMYSREYKYAGTSDLLFYDKRFDTLVIADFKTNKDLWKSYQMLKKPFSSLQQNNYNKYQLQLSYYQIMLEQAGYKVSNRALIWLKKDGNYEVHSTDDLTKELKTCLSKSSWIPSD